MPSDSPNNSLLQTVTNVITNQANEGNGFDTLINVLSLLSLILILNRTQPSMATSLSQNSSPTASGSTNPIQQLLGQLTKSGDGSGGGPSPDMLMSLLPLLNSPQVKSKLNPANISSILGMLGNFSGGGSNDKAETTKIDKPDETKTDKPDKPDKKATPAAAVSSALADHPTHISVTQLDEDDKKDLGRSLNWKSNFQNDKEV